MDRRSNDQDRAAERPHLPLHARIRRAGITVLILGLTVAAAIYLTAGEAGPDPVAQITSAPDYEFNLERIGGKAAVYTDRFNRWFTSLWHGRPLASTVAVLALAIALVCFKVSYMVLERSPDGADAAVKPDRNGPEGGSREA